MEELVQNFGLQWIAQEIFSYLTGEELFNCRLVSKSWLQFLDKNSKLWKQALINEKTKLEEILYEEAIEFGAKQVEKDES